MSRLRPEANSRLASVCLFLLFLVLPFEPRFTVLVGSFRLSLIEAVAVPCFIALFMTTRARGVAAWKSPALLCLVGFVAVALVSAALSEVEPSRALKFALRLGAMTTFAFLIARLTDTERRFGMIGLAISGAFAAALALLEGLGVRSFDVFLGAFREIPFNVAGVRRATAGSEYPNLGAAMIVYALLVGVVRLRGQRWKRLGCVALMASGIVFTYSRGGWLAALAGLLSIGAVEWKRDRTAFMPAIAFALIVGLFITRGEISQLRLGGENANDFYAASYKVPLQLAMDPGVRTTLPVTIRNVGRRAWRKTDEMHLSYHLYESGERPLVDGPRTDLPHDVLPGESVTIQASLRAPANSGDYLVMWDLVHEDTTWFSGQGVKPGVVRLIVGSDPPKGRVISETDAMKAIPDTLAWRPSRSELWSLAFRMWKSHPLLGVGPDNFRWTYGAVAEKSTFDTRVFANNMFLEIAATLGTLGLMAFVAALIFALRQGWTQAPHSDIALTAFAILVAMTVHGVADYLLAFSGHYLVFGFAIGALARRPRV
ncbi:MAG: O-antigen ligase family protein [Vicinamibacteria bacterium]